MLRLTSHKCISSARYLPKTTFIFRRTFLSVKDPLYANQATATGTGRSGPVVSTGDAPLELNFSRPRTIGGKGTGQTPEQLLAMSYSSCFLSTLQYVASKANKPELAHGAKVHTNVQIGPPEISGVPGFALTVDLTVEGINDDDIILDAHGICPFSRAFQEGIKVNIRKM